MIGGNKATSFVRHLHRAVALADAFSGGRFFIDRLFDARCIFVRFPILCLH